MLQIYTEMPSDDPNFILSNDLEFNIHSIKRIVDKTEGKLYRETLSKIEGVEFIDHEHILSKMDNQPIHLSSISTGCKTIINIMLNPDKIICALECGKNFGKYIYTLKNGKIYAPYFLLPFNREEVKPIEIEIIHGKSAKIITDIYELERWYNELDK